MMRIVAVVAVALLCAFAAPAHPLTPSLLELEEQGAPGTFHVRWKTPRDDGALTPLLPPACAAIAGVRSEPVAGGWLTTSDVRCGAEGIAGATLAVSGLDTAGTDALVRIHFADGRSVRALLRPDAPSLVVPARESRLDVFVACVKMGAAHLFGGLDHVLFVAGLVALVRGRRRLVAAVTAFTAGHCATLALATFGAVHVPAALVEVAIAATLVWLALELASRADGTPAGAGIARRPIALPFAFGLLHGLGFASALASLGLPSAEIPLALAGFNAGIELGQLALIAVLLVPVMLARSLAARQAAGATRWAALLPAYAIGSLGIYWCLDRVAGAF